MQESRYKEVFSNEIEYKNALKIKDYLKLYLDYEEEETAEDVNSIIFSYVLNICELKGLTYKSDKMLVISEMSRSLFWGCISAILLNVFIIKYFSCPAQFLSIEIIVLFFMAAIFGVRKQRYEKYRLRILIRTFLIYMREEQIKREERIHERK